MDLTPSERAAELTPAARVFVRDEVHRGVIARIELAQHGATR